MEGKRQRALVSSTVYESFSMTRFSLLSFFHVLWISKQKNNFNNDLFTNAFHIRNSMC